MWGSSQCAVSLSASLSLVCWASPLPLALSSLPSVVREYRNWPQDHAPGFVRFGPTFRQETTVKQSLRQQTFWRGTKGRIISNGSRKSGVTGLLLEPTDGWTLEELWTGRKEVIGRS